MSKFKFKFKITGLEIEMEGSKDDVGNISSALGDQLKSMLQPTGKIIDTQFDYDEPEKQAALPVGTDNGHFSKASSKPKPRRKPKTSNNSRQEKGETAIDFRNDVAKYSAPEQTWTTLDKAIWLLYVLQGSVNIDEASLGEICDTFNKQFKQQGTIRPSNVSRDLGKKKSGSEALVGENTSTNPSKWYLTAKGSAYAQNLIVRSK